MSVDTFDYSGDAFRPSISKDPDAVLDYTFDWTQWLGGISDSIVTGPSPDPFVVTAVGVTIVSSALDATRKMVTVFCSGGNLLGDNYLTCRINTLGGRTEDRTIYFDIIER